MTDIVQETRKLAKASKLPVADICASAQVKPRWYFRFVAGDFKDPGANKISRLYEFLKNHAA